MTSIQPHEWTAEWQADQTAECLDVSKETYGELWNKCVPLYDNLPRGEYHGEVTYGLKKYGWNKLSDTAKLDVNKVLQAWAERELGE